MPYMIVFLFGPIGAVIALYRRNPKRFLDGPTEDAPLRLMRWAISLMDPSRAEWARPCSANLPTSMAGSGGCASRSAARVPRSCSRRGGGPRPACGR